MTIKRTAKYLAAVATTRKLGLLVAVKHSTADEVYSELESSGFYWDSHKGQWIENQKTDPLREMDKRLIRVRITAHMDKLDAYTSQLCNALQHGGLTIQEVSKLYPNVRDSDGAGRVYIAVRDEE
jgi:DNA-binding transcriptional regulator YhcF (GntR family)